MASARCNAVPAPHRLFLPAVLVLASLAAACSREPAPAALPAPQPVESVDAPAPNAAPAVLHMEFAADNGAIGTEIGERQPGLGLASRGKAGWLIFGPYVPMPPGRFEVRIAGTVLPGHAGNVHVDVAHSKGEVLVAALELDPAALLAGASGDSLVRLPFEIQRAVTDLEVRVRVDDTGRLAIASYQIDAVR